jgi:hypothetical protein
MGRRDEGTKDGTTGQGAGSLQHVDSLGVPMSPEPHVPRHRTGHIRGLISTERTRAAKNRHLALSVYRLRKVMCRIVRFVDTSSLILK